ncbi:hypothetical protein LPJ73_004852 [Coemansia sp. RSA 2703]|nr:hypothetical protein LPJ73_004852 [Coemansia sp. RSA 2703]KAJ2367509.1 hypothetical protein IW150_005654 [Coemansia sp. RSA 2607]KAJ2393935.1 hypothetical protein GGI05_002264 [Coemansia sp. RSA 2603]
MVAQYDIRGKVAVVTGGAQSIGLATAKSLVNLGAKVVIGDLLDTGAQVVEQINQEAGERIAFFQTCDVTDFHMLHNLIDAAVSEFGRFDILINNAGIFSMPVHLDTTGDASQRCINVNFNALVDATVYATNYWLAEPDRQGVVINLGSAAGYVPLAMSPVYSATKAAVNMFTKSLSELAPKIRVNAVAPEWVDTKLVDHENVGRDHPAVKFAGLIDPQVIADQIIRLIEDESMAGEIIRIKKNTKPEVCFLPNATKIIAISKQMMETMSVP